MTITRRLAAGISAAVLALCSLLAVATPAQAIPCNPTFPANVLNLHDSANFCNGRESYSIADMPTNHCIYLGAPRPGNWAGSVYNKTGRAIILSDSINCTGSPSAGLGAWGMIYDLTSYNLYNKVSSIRVV